MAIIIPPHFPPGTFDLTTGLVVNVAGTVYLVTVDRGVDLLRLASIANVEGDSQTERQAGVSGINNNGGTGVSGYANAWDAIVGETKSDAHAGVTGRNLTTGANGGVGIYGVGGRYAGKFDGDVQVNGTLNVKGDIWMPAADFAEDFPVQASEDVEPGTVMVLDENGVLRPSDKSYDKKVAGVVSGAGGYRPGLILDRQKSSDGRLPLALAGKVYCKADATLGAIEVGDLLTTSPTPGHAMKASDPLLAFGAVLGKALQPLTSGQGMIPILIALQ